MGRVGPAGGGPTGRAKRAPNDEGGGGCGSIRPATALAPAAGPPGAPIPRPARPRAISPPPAPRPRRPPQPPAPRPGGSTPTADAGSRAIIPPNTDREASLRWLCELVQPPSDAGLTPVLQSTEEPRSRTTSTHSPRACACGSALERRACSNGAAEGGPMIMLSRYGVGTFRDQPPAAVGPLGTDPHPWPT